MAPFDDWNKIDEDEEEELQDSSVRSIRATSEPDEGTEQSP